MPRMALVPRAARRTAALSLFLLVVASDLHAAHPIDVTDRLKLRFSGFRVDRRTGELVQAITVTNRGTRSIEGKLYLVLADLDAGITVKGGKLVKATLGSTITLPLQISNKPLLKAGQSAVSTIRFVASSNTPVRYRVRVLQDSSNP